MSYCKCVAKVYNPKPKTCTDCLVANDIIVGCGQGLKPCGDTTTINLNTYNNNPSDAVYTIRTNGYSSGDFSAVSVTSAGVLSVTTGTNYTPHGLHEIDYEVTKGKYKNMGTIKICFDSPCTGGCTKCNTCTGECYGSSTPGTATAECNEVGKTYNAATGLNLGACDGTTTWTVAAPSAIAPIINSAGLITYNITNLAIPGQTYRMTWKASCSLYGMEVEGYVDVTVEDKCVGVTCENANQECNKCTGICEDKESDLDATTPPTSGGTVIGSGGTIGVTIG